MTDWFTEISSGSELSHALCEELLECGLVVIPGAFTSQQLSRIAHAYDLAVAAASPPDLSIGRGTTRVHDLVLAVEQLVERDRRVRVCN